MTTSDSRNFSPRAAFRAVAAVAAFAFAGGPASSQTASDEAPRGGHEVRLEGMTFLCGEIQDGKQIRGFMHSVPPAKYIPGEEPAAGDPLRPSWLLVHRIICDGDAAKKPRKEASGHVAR